jgi:hypothetical protein
MPGEIDPQSNLVDGRISWLLIGMAHAWYVVAKALSMWWFGRLA